MAVNEKVVYATGYTSHNGKLFAPGEQLSGNMPDHALRGAIEGGLTTDSHAGAERARGAEQERQRQVAEQQRRRTLSPEERASLGL